VARVTDRSRAATEYRGVPDIIVPSTWRERLEAISGRRRDLWAVLGLVALVVAFGVVLWRGSAPPQIAPPATSGAADEAPAPLSPLPSASPTPPGAVVLVHVAGAVRRPGLYELDAGARVADAVEAAGGPRRPADLDALNLAETLTDGYKVDVPRRGEVAVAVPPPGASASPAAAPVDLNQADQAALEAIPGIGPVKAAAILEYRAQIGSFSSIDQLLEVSGIGPATLESMRPYVTV
jgi:competence protein ComEA